MRRLAALIALLLAALASSAAWAQLPARPEGPIADYANILDPTDEASLDARLRDYNQSTGRAIIVATVSSLNGEEIEPYAQRLAEEWGIGGLESENGVLFLVAPSERKLRIHTARGLQERLTDIMSGRIIRDAVVPRFKAGDMSGGIAAGVDAIIAQLDMDPAQARAIEEAQAAAERARQSQGGFPIGALFWLVFIVLFFILPMLSRGGRRRRRRGSPWGNTARDIILWEAGSAIARGMLNSGGGGGGWGGGGGGGFGGFGGGGGGFNGGGASGGW